MFEGLACARSAVETKVSERGAVEAPYEWIECKDSSNCPHAAEVPSRWSMGHTSIYSDAINAFVRNWAERRKPAAGTGSTKLGLVLADKPIQAPESISTYASLFTTLDDARHLYQGSVGRSLVVIKRVEALSTPEGALAVKFFAYDYVSRLRDGSWELDWQGFEQIVAVRRSDGVLEIREVGGASS
jgi:hypothetical protein